MIGLWDADGYVYGCAFVAQPKNEEIKPLSFALHAFDTAYEAVARNFDSLKLYISGKGNWRIPLATIKPYKGNRVQEKPVYYNEVRQYMIEKYGAIVCDGMEADDAVAMEQTENTCIIATDKDLLQVPGNHYNPSPKYLEYKYIDEKTGNRNFYLQVLTGDTVDNIPGIFGVGPVTAKKLLGGVSSERGMWQVCRYQWHSNYPDGIERESGGRISAGDALNEVTQLLWVSRKDRERFVPPC